MQLKKFALTLACASLVSAGWAQTTTLITLTNSDATGISSFNAAGNWDAGLAPVSGSPNVNAYFTTNFTLRTPTGGNNYTFAGDSLSLDPLSTNITAVATYIGTGTLSLRGYGLITVANLLLNGGIVANGGTGGSPDTAWLSGNVTANAASTVDGGGSAAATLNVLAPIGGVAGINIQNLGTVILSGTNTYAGQTTVGNNSGSATGYLKVGNSNAIPRSLSSGDNLGNLRVNFVTNLSLTAATFDLNGHNVTVNELITGNSNGIQPQIVNNAVNKTNTLTIGYGDNGSFTFRGVIKDNTGTGGQLALTKVGSAVFSLSTPVGNLAYSGDTTFAGGTVVMGASLILPWGNGRGNLLVSNPAVLNLGGRSEVVNGLFGDGTIDDLAVGNSTLHFGSNDVSSVFSGTIQNSSSGILQLQKWGTGTATLSGNNSFVGAVTVNNGILRVTQNSSLGAGAKNIKISSVTGDAQLHLDGSGGDLTLDASLSFLTAGTNGAIVSEAGNNVINGTISLITGGATTIRTDAGTLTLNNVINILTNTSSRVLTLGGAASGAANGPITDGSSAAVPNTNLLSLIKAGAGAWTLATNNTYSGATVINNGTLALGVFGSLSNTPSITLQSNATLDVSAVAGWKLGASQTLTGSGNVAGNVRVDGTVAPGTATALGALVFSNQLTLANATILKLNRTNAVNADKITAATLIRGGALTVTNVGDALQAGDTFTLLSVTGASGTFTATNLPALSAGLAWTNTLSADGKLAVISTGPAPQPHITGISLSGTNLIISGTNGLAGEHYSLLTSTNLALPLNQWTLLATNSFAGSIFNLTNAVNSNAPRNFYLLRVP